MLWKIHMHIRNCTSSFSQLFFGEVTLERAQCVKITENSLILASEASNDFYIVLTNLCVRALFTFLSAYIYAPKNEVFKHCATSFLIHFN